MNYYSIALFLHIVGALGFFVALGLEWTRLRQIQSATTSEEVRASMRVYKSVRRFGMASMLTILVFGFYMAAVAWGGPAWITVALGSLVLIIVITIVLTRRKDSPPTTTPNTPFDGFRSPGLWIHWINFTKVERKGEHLWMI